MNGKIDSKYFADYQGKRIYFCCSGCIEEFKKDPEKYLKKMEAEGVTPEKTP
jgi:YHS domain-containing protein